MTADGGDDARGRAALHALDPRSARQRLLLAVVAGVGAWLAAGSVTDTLRGLLAWDAAALTLLGLAWWIIARADSDETQRRAAAEDPGRTFVWLVVIGASLSGVIGAAGVLHTAAGDPHGDAFVLALSVVTVALSWLITHTAFTLRYAHLYYRGGPGEQGGLQFAGGDAPDDFDFAYFAFTIGMCFQVSDVSVCRREMRRMVLGHSLLSFAYNTLIVALVLNLVIGHL